MTQHEAIDQALAELGRTKTVSVSNDGSAITDHGWHNGRVEKPCTFYFDKDGALTGYDRQTKALWISFLIWWYLL